MTRFVLDSGIVSDYIDRRNGVYDRARAEVSNGSPVGVGVPVLARWSPGSGGAGAATGTCGAFNRR
jgi:hypothetical protein